MLYIQEPGLMFKIVVEGMKWYDYAERKEVKCMAKSGQQQGGKVIVKNILQEDTASYSTGDQEICHSPLS